MRFELFSQNPDWNGLDLTTAEGLGLKTSHGAAQKCAVSSSSLSPSISLDYIIYIFRCLDTCQSMHNHQCVFEMKGIN